MGCADFYPEESPVRRVEVDGFWIDDHPVTVAEFRRFVAATGYVTVAERPLDPAQYPGADPALPAKERCSRSRHRRRRHQPRWERSRWCPGRSAE